MKKAVTFPSLSDKRNGGKKIVKQTNDQHIDQDFSGYTVGTSKTNMITPKSKTDRRIADMDKKTSN